MQQVLQALHRVEDKLDRVLGRTDVEILTVSSSGVPRWLQGLRRGLFYDVYECTRFAKVIHSQGGKITGLPT